MRASSLLQNLLDSAPTKLNFSELIVNSLGPSRLLKFYRSSNAASTEPRLDGVEVFRCQLTGDMITSNGDIVFIGNTSDATIQQVADILTGAWAVVIEGGGNWISATFGPARSLQIENGVTEQNLKDYEYTFPEAFGPSIGVAFSKGAQIRAPIFLPSGTGAPAPEPTSDEVVAFRVMDYTNEANPVSAGIGYISVREPDLVMNHSWMADEYGDVRIMRCPDNSGVVLGTGGDAFRFSAMSFHQNASTNSEANVPLQQVKINCVPHGRWSNFPFRGTFISDYDTLIPPAHKIELLRADGSIKDVIELYSNRDANNTPGSGMPVNHSQQTINPRNGKPAQAFWTCHMVHEWWSHRPKYFSKVDHFIPGITADGMYARNTTELASQNQCWPIITGQDQADGMDCFTLAPKWSRPLGPTTGFDTTIISPHWVISQATRNNYITQVIGYGFEPGATCMHTWYMGMGGSRSDRACFPSSVVAWATQKEGTRAHGAVPYKEMLHHWNMGYMNEGCHYFTNLERGLGIPKSKVLNAEVCYNDTYYRSTQENFRPDLPNNAVRLLAAVNKGANPLDKNGRHYTNAYSRDYMHSQSTGATGAYTYISASHVYEARHSFTSHILATFQINRDFPSENFLTRQHAWHMWQFVNMWIVGNNGPDGFTALEIEDMTRRHLEVVHDSVMPLYNSPTSIYGKSLRILGMTAKQTDNTTKGMSNIGMITDSKAFYFGQTLMMWKQSGFFDIMKSKSQKCSDILDLIVISLAKFSVGVFVDANGRLDQMGSSYYWPIGTEPQFTSWADLCPPNELADWLRKEDGSLTTRDIDSNNTMHFRAQFVHILRDYFPEYNFPRVDEAAAIVDGFYKVIADGTQNGTSWKFKFRFPMMGVFKKAAKIGAPV